ncbi:Dna2/Cas4 domain-containing protein [Kamptonema cortianum]|nr:Dna2/Cas4 domain-containing protein [Kamptonema cortianum]
MQALHCERRAWLAANHPELKAPNSRGLELRLQQGQQIGRIAHQLFPGGSFPTGSNDAEFATATVKLLENKSPIYEGVFLAKNCSARVDILTPNEAGWTLVEVKSSTRVKPEHIQDIAFQAWVAKESGVTIQKFAVAHINSGFRLRAELDDPWEFFEVVDVTPDVMEALSELPPLIEGLSGIFADVEPSTEPGLHCRRPDRCAFYDHCHQEIPPNDTRFFPGIGQEQIDALRARGQVTIEQVEAINRLTAVQSRAIKAAKEKKDRG